jgi:hypothetical protein
VAEHEELCKKREITERAEEVRQEERVSLELNLLKSGTH